MRSHAVIPARTRGPDCGCAAIIARSFAGWQPVAILDNSDQAFIISQRDEFLERLPNVVRYLLFDLKTTFWIDSDSLQVADHNIDDQVARQIFGGIFKEGDGRR